MTEQQRLIEAEVALHVMEIVCSRMLESLDRLGMKTMMPKDMLAGLYVARGYLGKYEPTPIEEGKTPTDYAEGLIDAQPMPDDIKEDAKEIFRQQFQPVENDASN